MSISHAVAGSTREKWGGDTFLSINAEDRGAAAGVMPSFTVEGAAIQIAKFGQSWAGGAPGAVVTFAFRGSAPGTMPDDTSGFSPFNQAQINHTLLALNAWSDVADITFVRVADRDADTADLVFGNYASGAEGAAAFAYLPGAGVGGDVWINSSLWYNASPSSFNYGGHALLHEIGHAIGLLHPGEYNAGEGDPTYADAEYREDTRQFSVMSYWSEANTGANFGGAFPQSPMLDDIVAIQLLYGPNMAANTDATTYTLSAGRPVFSIWDAGGYDTLDFSAGNVDQLIDLRPGHFSNAGGLTGNVSIAPGAVIERAIGGSGDDTIIGSAYVTPIDVADLVVPASRDIGAFGSAVSLDGAFDRMFDPKIISSTEIPHATVRVSNAGGDHPHFRFTGGAGETVIVDIDETVGMDAVVRIYNSAGVLLASNDDGPMDMGSAIRQDSMLAFTLPASGVYYIVVGQYEGAGSGGHAAYAPLAAGTEFTLNVSLTGVATPGGSVTGTTLVGMAGDDTLIGGEGADVLDGRDGADSMTGGPGNDYYVFDDRGDRAYEEPGEGLDTVRARVTYTLQANIENLTLFGTGSIGGIGNDLNNRIIGNVGDNELQGGLGRDRMEGGLGNDSYLAEKEDKVIELANEGIDTIRTSDSWTLATHFENLTLIGASNTYGGGNAKANVIIGNSGGNTIYGGALGDTLRGGDGQDRFLYLAASDSTVANPDQILDLRFNETIDLSAIDADSTTAGDQAFVLIDAFTGQAGQMTVTYDAATGLSTTLMDIDGDGDADMALVLNDDQEAFQGWVL